MPIKSSQTIADRLNAAQVAINNTLTDSEIQSLVAAYGYNEVRWTKVNNGTTRLCHLSLENTNAQIAGEPGRLLFTLSKANGRNYEKFFEF